MAPIIWYVHGASSSPKSFAFIKTQLPEHEYLDIAYDSDDPVMGVIESLVEKASYETRPIYIVAHSLGGVISVATSLRAKNIQKIVTLASPFGGSKVASLMRWIFPSQLLNDMNPHSEVMSLLKRNIAEAEILSIVTTAGHTPLISEENDGVVTIDSQKSLRGPVYITIPVNHFEVLLTQEVPELISGFFFNDGFNA